MKLFDRLKKADINVYDLSRINFMNVETLLQQVESTQQKEVLYDSISDRNLDRRVWEQSFHAIAEVNYVLNNNPNADILNVIDPTPIG